MPTTQIIVRFQPDYTNKAKDVICANMNEANHLYEWFQKQGVRVECLQVRQDEEVLRTSDESMRLG